MNTVPYYLIFERPVGDPVWSLAGATLVREKSNEIGHKIGHARKSSVVVKRVDLPEVVDDKVVIRLLGAEDDK